MADYTTINTEYNTGTDGSPVWTGTAMNMAGSAGQHEARWQRTGGGGGATTGSAAWPFITRPVANAAVEECWIFTTSDNSGGVKVGTYDGTRNNSLMFRLNFDALGSPATTMQFSGGIDAVDTTPTPGTQTGGASDGRNIINGQVTDTSSTSYLKGNCYGSGLTNPGVQEAPSAGACGTTLAAASGSGGAATPGAGAWLATWQSLQLWTQYIQGPAVPKATTAFKWYFCLALYVGPNMQTGTFVFVPWILKSSILAA